MQMRLLLFLLLPLYAFATIRTVGPSGKDHTTIQACANVAVAGDSCIVYAGTYAEYVTVANSGSSGSPITFQSNAGDSVTVLGFSIDTKNYIVIGGAAANEGFEITGAPADYMIALDAVTHVTIQNNNIHHGGGASSQCIRNAFATADRSSYVTIKSNTISWCGDPPVSPGAGMIVMGDHWLIEGNTISHVSDYISIYGSYHVVRNNHFGPTSVSDFPGTSDPLHVDGLESSCSGEDAPLIHALIEGNVIQASRGPDMHFALMRDTNSCGATGNIWRRNAAYGLGSYWISTADNFLNHHIYNNSVSGSQLDISPKDYTDLSFTNTTTGAKLLNNIFVDMWRAGGGGYVYYIDSGSQTGFVANYNLAWQSDCGTSCSWQTPLGGYAAGEIRNQNPLYVNAASDLQLQAGSPAIDAGTALTTVAVADTGSGTSLVVTDAWFFSDGYGTVNGDWIRVGASTTVQISSINYTTNTITLASDIARSDGDSVYLYRDSNGDVVLVGSAPDIGAFEYSSGGGGAATHTIRGGVIRGATIR